jgi:hypothetical protein
MSAEPFEQAHDGACRSARMRPSASSGAHKGRLRAHMEQAIVSQRCVSATAVPNGGVERQTESHVVLAHEDDAY